MSLKFSAVVPLALGAFVAAAEPARLEPLAAVPVPDMNGPMVNETPSLWFVELSGAPVSEGGDRTAVVAEQATFRAAASSSGARYAERNAYQGLFNGFSVKVTPSELGKLRQLAGVRAVHPVIAIPAPQMVGTGTADLFTALSMTGADIAQSELGFTGRGVKVGVIDTGIDYDSGDLGGDGVARANSPAFPNSRVKRGWDFVGDAFNADTSSPNFSLAQVPDGYPDDCAGHGTHVAGIIGASGFVTGVAPKAQLASYRVFGCEGSTTADVMIAAMERALDDGMQIINISIGGAFTWPTYPTALAANRLVKKGVVVVASIGNSGSSGLYSAGAPGLGKDVIGVASFDNVDIVLNLFRVSPDGAAIGFTPAVGAPVPPIAGPAPLARTGTSTTADDGCAALPAGSLAGKVALIRRGTCSFYAKASNAEAAGAVGMLLYNNTAGRISPTVAGSPAIGIPVVAISAAEGALIDGRLAAGGAIELTWTSELGSFPQATGNLLSSFSSYGLSPDLDLKPDLGAPGGSIFSTFPLELGGYASLSGTSMASPHVAGAVALLLEARHDLEAKEVRGILQNAAEPKPWFGNPAYGLLDNVSRQGAGMVRIDEAIISKVKVTPSKLALGESESGPVTRTLEIENDARRPVTYALSYVNGLSVAKTFTPAFYTSDATVAFDSPTVTVPGHGERHIKVTVTPPTGPDKAQYGGYVVLTPVGGGQIKRVPFAGFVGDYQSIQAMAPTAYGFPWLAALYEGSYYQVTGPDDWAYSMVGDDVPLFLVHFDHQSRLLQVDISDAAGKAVGRASTDEYLSRNSGPTGFFNFTWDGTVTRGRHSRTITVPNGNYTATFSLLKALGDPSNPADWETWVSPLIAVLR